MRKFINPAAFALCVYQDVSVLREQVDGGGTEVCWDPLWQQRRRSWKDTSWTETDTKLRGTDTLDHQHIEKLVGEIKVNICWQYKVLDVEKLSDFVPNPAVYLHHPVWETLTCGRSVHLSFCCCIEFWSIAVNLCDERSEVWRVCFQCSRASGGRSWLCWPGSQSPGPEYCSAKSLGPGVCVCVLILWKSSF